MPMAIKKLVKIPVGGIAIEGMLELPESTIGLVAVGTAHATTMLRKFYIIAALEHY
jgi:hypothetical protein